MVRKLALSLAVASAIAAGQANALGLGEIRVNSALNEPLDADIRLVQVRDLLAQQILPRMADIDEFSLAGLTKSRFLTDVKFQVKVAPDGSGSIHVTSSVPVQEPFLSFLMEVNWPQGRLVREYTLLLDPPVFDPAPVTTAINAPAATTPAAPAGQPAAATAQRSNIQINVDGGEIFVKSNDTLYVLAKNSRSASDISIEQMMVAMQRKNPELFPTSNINVMHAGKVMKLPTAEEARALTRKQAIAEAARQTAEWKAGRRAAAAPKAQKEPKAPPEPAAAEVQTGGVAEGAPDGSESQLKIVTADKADEKPAEMDGSVSSDASDDIEAEAAEAEVEEAVVDTGPSEREMELIQRNEDLENRLLVTQESVDKVSRENAELGEKLDSIQEQLAAMQRLIELKDQQMSALQAEMLKQVQEANKPKPSPVDEFINIMMANPLYLGGAGGVLLLLLALAALTRRRKSVDYDDEPAPRKPKKGKKSKQEESLEDEIPEFDESTAPAAAATGIVAGATLANEAQADPVDELDDLDDLDDLDLDMVPDLDDDLSPASAEVDASDMEAIDESELSGSEIDSVLDDILDEDVATDATEKSQEADDLDALPDSDDIDTDLDELLKRDLEDDLLEDESVDELDDDEFEGLEFAIDDSVGEEAVTEEVGDLIDEEFFSEEIEPESELVAEADAVEEAELIDEPIEMATAEIDESELLEEPDAIPEADLDELNANIAHDLDMSLEDELDDMLAEDDGDIELVEEGDDEDLIEDDLLDSLDGADEVETKLDLARAYIEMDDTEGARDILSEITRDGNAEQQAEAQSLLDKLS